MIGDLTSAPEPIAIKLFSQDPALLKQWATAVGDTIKKLPGVVDVLNGIENTVSGPARTFMVDPVAAARAGFSAQELELDASAILQGEPSPNPGGSSQPGQGGPPRQNQPDPSPDQPTNPRGEVRPNQ
jgi:multidrug efflux pump subunit AcrB